MLIRISATIVVAALLAGRGLAQESPADTARAFFTAYAAGDVAHATNYWTPGAADRFRQRAVRAARARCLVLRDLDVRVVEAGDEQARVDIDATAAGWAGGGRGVASLQTLHKSVELVRDGEGWRVAAFDDREQQVADDIAAASADQRAAIAKASGELRTPLLAILLTRHAITMVNRQRFADSEQLLGIAEEIAAATGDAAAYAEVLSATCTLLNRGPRHDIDEALRLGKQSVAWAGEADAEADVLARSLLRLGRAGGWVSMGEERRAPFLRIVELSDRVEHVATLAHAHSALAADADDHLDHRSAFRHSLITAKYAEESGDVASRLNAGLNLAGAFNMQGDAELAALHYKRVAALAREAGFNVVLSLALHAQARIYSNLQDGDSFLKTMQEAFAAAAGEWDATAELLLTRASWSKHRGDLPAAERDLQTVHERIDGLDPHARAQYFTARASLFLDQGRCEEAAGIAKRGCDFIDGECFSPGVWIHALLCLGRREEAIAAALQWIEAAEEQRSRVVAEPMQLGFFQDQVSSVYELTALTLFEEGRVRESLTVAERLKARVLSSVRSDLLVTSDRLEGNDRVAYQRLNDRVGALNRAVVEAVARGEQTGGLRKELAEARIGIRELLARTDAALFTDAPPAPPPVHEAVVPAPPPGVVALEYLITNERLLVFVVTRNADGTASIIAKALPVGRDEIAKQVTTFLDSIEQRDLRAGQHGRALYRLLVEPVESLIPRGNALCVIPSGAIWRVPFHALRNRNGRYLAELTNVYYAPSLATLSAPHKPRSREPNATLLALANPNLRARTKELYRSVYGDKPLGAIPETEREVRALASIYGAKNSRIYIGDDAEEAVVKRESPKFRVLHIATHGIVDEKAPMFSAVVLSTRDTREDGLLEAREIAELHLGADLAVLSACETARGRVSIGEGVIGLSWALLAAGCPTAVVSQWRADSESTADLMIAFHRDLVRTNHRSPVESLRRAQLSLLRGGRYAHPYYWAPFIVIGRDR